MGRIFSRKSPGALAKARAETAPRLSFAGDTSASVAIEFALLGPAFFGLALSALLVSYVEFAGAQLDAASRSAARAVMIGQATNITQVKAAVCGAIGGIVPCNEVMVSIAPAGSLSSINAATPTLTFDANGAVTNPWSSNFGSSGSILVMQLVYQLPVVAAPLFSFGSLGNGARMLVSTQVFVAG
jgi:Flp pilus assembly protein TadG